MKNIIYIVLSFMLHGVCHAIAAIGDSVCINIPVEKLQYDDQELNSSGTLSSGTLLFRDGLFFEKIKDESDYGISSELDRGICITKDKDGKYSGYQTVDFKQVLSPKEKVLFVEELKRVPDPVIPEWVFEKDIAAYKMLYKDGYAYAKMFLVYKPLNEISYYEGDNRPWINGFRDAMKEKGYSLNDFADYGVPPPSRPSVYIEEERYYERGSGVTGKSTFKMRENNRPDTEIKLTVTYQREDKRIALPEGYEEYMMENNRIGKEDKQKQFNAILSKSSEPKENPYKEDKDKAAFYEQWYRRGYAFTVSGFGAIKFLTTDWDNESRRPILDGWTDGQRAGFEAYLGQFKEKQTTDDKDK